MQEYVGSREASGGGASEVQDGSDTVTYSHFELPADSGTKRKERT